MMSMLSETTHNSCRIVAQHDGSYTNCGVAQDKTRTMDMEAPENIQEEKEDKGGNNNLHQRSTSSSSSSSTSASVSSSFFDRLVFSGGSTQAIAFIGCIRYMEEQDVLKRVHTVAGTSAGALISLMVVLGMTSQEMEIWTTDKLIEKQANRLDVDLDDVLDLYYSMGLDKGVRLSLFIEDMIFHYSERKLQRHNGEKTQVSSSSRSSDNNDDNKKNKNKVQYVRKNWTFSELFRLTGKTLIVCASNLTTSSAEYFSHFTSPDVSVTAALRASMCLPVFYAPMIINGMMYSDGGIFDNLPLSAVMTDHPPKKNPTRDNSGEKNGTENESNDATAYHDNAAGGILGLNIPWCMSSVLPTNIVNYATYMVTSLLIRANNSRKRDFDRRFDESSDTVTKDAAKVCVIDIENQEQAHPFFGFRMGLDDDMEFAVDKNTVQKYINRGRSLMSERLKGQKESRPKE